MIFDALPILSAGGTNISPPHMYEIYVDSTERVLRLEGEGVITFWGYWTSSAYYARSIYEDALATCTLEIDGTTYSHRSATSSSNLITGGYMDAPIQYTNASSSVNNTPTAYVFYEYLEVTIKKKGSSGSINFCFQYYDLDADNPVTVTFA